MKPISIQVNKINVDEFSFKDYGIKSIDNNKLKLNFGVYFDWDKQKKILIVKFKVIYLHLMDGTEVELLKYVQSFYFNINGVDEFKNHQTNEINVPEDVLVTLLGTSIGAARGIISQRIIGTILSNHNLPLLSPKMFLQEILRPEKTIENKKKKPKKTAK